MEKGIISNGEYIYDDISFPKINLSSGIIRIVLLNNCNYKCSHCFKEGERNNIQNSNNIEFILKVVKHGYVNFGIKKVKLTGGEPLLFPNLDSLLEGIREIGITDIDITTNGYFILDKINTLSKYNVKKITVTLNTLDNEMYKAIHKCDDNALRKVLDGLEALKMHNSFHVSLNIVALDITGQNIMDLLNYAWENNFTPRICEPTHIEHLNSTEKKVQFAQIYSLLEKDAVRIIESKCSSVINLVLSNSKKVVMLKSLCDRRMCNVCGKYMYIRLTSEGRLKPCLSRVDTEVQIPRYPEEDDLNRCFTVAINNMGNGLNEDCKIGLSVV